MRRVLWWISAGSAVLFAGGAVLFLTQGIEWHRRFDEWITARPAELTVDLSTPGLFEAELDQTCSIAHAEVFELVPADGSAAFGTDPGTLKGLEATLRIIDSGGRVVLTEPFPPTGEWLGPRSDGLVVFRVAPFATGRYRVEVDVTAGASGLAGVKQRLVARYELCGLERLPGTIAYGFSAGCGMTALLIGAVLGGMMAGARAGRVRGAADAGASGEPPR